MVRSEVQFTFRNGVESSAKAVSLFVKEVGVRVRDRSKNVQPLTLLSSAQEGMTASIHLFGDFSEPFLNFKAIAGPPPPT